MRKRLTGATDARRSAGASRWSAGVGPIQVGIAMGADGTLYAGTTDGYVIALAP